MMRLPIILFLCTIFSDKKAASSCEIFLDVSVRRKWCEGDFVELFLVSDVTQEHVVTASVYMDDFVSLGTYSLKPIDMKEGNLLVGSNISIENVPVGNHTVLAFLIGHEMCVKYATFTVDHCFDNASDSCPKRTKQDEDRYKLVIVAAKPAQPFNWLDTGQPSA